MTSSQVSAIIKQLENDKQALQQISRELKEVGETIINYSNSLQNISDLLFEGYNIDGKRFDGKMIEYAEEYKRYGDELLYLAEVIHSDEIRKLELEITSKRILYNELVNDEKNKN